MQCSKMKGRKVKVKALCLASLNRTIRGVERRMACNRITMSHRALRLERERAREWNGEDRKTTVEK